MKRFVLITLLLVGIIVPASAQNDDLYFVPKKKAKVEKNTSSASESSEVIAEESEEFSAPIAPAKSLEMDEDTYNRRGSYLTEQGDAVSEFAMSDEGFVLITEEGDTMWMNTDTLRLARVTKDDGWVGGFEGSDSDYEYAMRIVRFRNPRYAIPVSSPLYWDVVYGGALWPSWEWNIYDDGMYADVFPTRSNWYYWDYMTSYPMGWGPYWVTPMVIITAIIGIITMATITATITALCGMTLGTIPISTVIIPVGIMGTTTITMPIIRVLVPASQDGAGILPLIPITAPRQMHRPAVRVVLAVLQRGGRPLLVQV